VTREVFCNIYTFPLAPFTWQAPYPYTASEVRWPLQKILEAESRPGSQPESKPTVEIGGVPERAVAQTGA